MRYWVNTISRSHVQEGIAGGFIQAGQGNDGRLKRLTRGDRVLFYSPRAEHGAGDAVQRFTGLAEVVDEEPFEVDGWQWRRRVKFLATSEVPIHPLIEQLEFIPNKKSWGFPFRRGFFEINETDFATIARAMTAPD